MTRMTMTENDWGVKRYDVNLAAVAKSWGRG